MAEKQETVADIRKEAEGRFRKFCIEHVKGIGHLRVMQEFNHVFDRIEAALRKQLAVKDEALEDCKVFLGETIQCGVEGEMLDGRHVNVAASDLADKIDDLLKGVVGKEGGAK